jgi:histone H3/H4
MDIIEDDDHNEELNDENKETNQSKNIKGKGSGSNNSLPLSRVKNIMKCDPDVSLAGHETIFLMARFTELFIGHLGRKAHHYTKIAKRKTIQDKDITSCITANDELSFLEGML